MAIRKQCKKCGNNGNPITKTGNCSLCERDSDVKESTSENRVNCRKKSEYRRGYTVDGITKMIRNLRTSNLVDTCSIDGIHIAYDEAEDIFNVYHAGIWISNYADVQDTVNVIWQKLLSFSIMGGK